VNTNALKRLLLDAAMSALMILLMAYQVMGDAAHEIAGTAVGVLFLAHAWLNRRWFATFYKGAFTPLRALQNTMIVLVLLDTLVVMVTGVIISGTVFSFLNISAGIALARTLHLCSSYWALVLMSAHVGVHWSAVMGMARSVFGLPRRSGLAAWGFRALAAAVAVRGAWAFHHLQVWPFLTLQNQFAFFDDAPDWLVLLNWTCVMGLFVFVSYYAGRAAQFVFTRLKERA